MLPVYKTLTSTLVLVSAYPHSSDFRHFPYLNQVDDVVFEKGGENHRTIFGVLHREMYTKILHLVYVSPNHLLHF